MSFPTLRMISGGAVGLALLAVSAAPACATVVLPMAFSEIVAQSDLIVVGTARHATARFARGGRTISTYVTFTDLVVQKGRVGGPTLVLELGGGKVGLDRIVVVGMPQFEPGRRYLLHVRGNGRYVSPITGFNQGVFEIARRGGREVLRNWQGRELIAIQNDRFVFARGDATRSMKADPGMRVVAGWQPAHPNADALERPLRASADRRPVVPACSMAGTPATRGVAPVYVSKRHDPGTRVTLQTVLRRAARAAKGGAR